ncbi:hypothetical protein PLICBS_000331 [Purpureocillium lilacinum]|uniref:uncharacterized protein n=1 Tax=Purpureocillium lilacinum TaxID=33203 RepID=UPI002082986A|nr:hypothetical protein PLICBS_000331 [Purpureocillium lilacinum]
MGADGDADKDGGADKDTGECKDLSADMDMTANKDVDAVKDAGCDADEKDAAPGLRNTRSGGKRLSLSSSLSFRRRLSEQLPPERLERSDSKLKRISKLIRSGSTALPTP